MNMSRSVLSHLPRLTRPTRLAKIPHKQLRSFTHFEGTGLSATQYAEGQEKAVKWMREEGWDIPSLVEQDIIWGHQDSFAHVNNVHYFRYFETARMHFVKLLVPEMNDPVLAELGLVRGKKEGGVGVILGRIEAIYKRPVTYPDVLLVGHRPKAVLKDRFVLESCCFSYLQQKLVTLGNCEMVMYDYGTLKKSSMPEDMKAALERRMRK